MDMKIGTKACAIPNKSGGLRASRQQGFAGLIRLFFLWCQATSSLWCQATASSFPLASSGARLLLPLVPGYFVGAVHQRCREWFCSM